MFFKTKPFYQKFKCFKYTVNMSLNLKYCFSITTITDAIMIQIQTVFEGVYG